MSDLAEERKHVHALLDRLRPEQLSALRALLESMLDPIDRKLVLAPLDDEPETEEERQAVAEAIESLKRNGGGAGGSGTSIVPWARMDSSTS